MVYIIHFICVNPGYVYSFILTFLFYIRYASLVTIDAQADDGNSYVVNASLSAYRVSVDWWNTSAGFDMCAVGYLNYSSENPCIPSRWKVVGFLSEISLFFSLVSTIFVCGPGIFNRYFIFQRFGVIATAAFAFIIHLYSYIMLVTGAVQLTEKLSQIRNLSWISFVNPGSSAFLFIGWMVYIGFSTWNVFGRRHFLKEWKIKKRQNKTETLKSEENNLDDNLTPKIDDLNTPEDANVANNLMDKSLNPSSNLSEIRLTNDSKRQPLIVD